MDDPVIWSPYCGSAPTPTDLAARWNLDPVLLLGLGAVVAAYAVLRRGRAGFRDGLAAGGFLALAIAFVSPLCALSSALFSVRVIHHALLILVAAPLFAFGLPRLERGPKLALAAFAHAILFWFWHAPPPYAWALASDLAYWLMQLSLFGPALLFWLAVRTARSLSAIGALLATMVQMGLLGALITFAAQPLYAPHLATTWAFGLSPLTDQQAAGLIMWAPMAAVYLIASLVLAFRDLAPPAAEAKA